jgi:hypothetical protein
MYIVYYTTGAYDDFQRHNMFVTESKLIASEWIEKFNRIANKWYEYYKQNQDELQNTTIRNIFYFIDVNESYYEQIDVR